jgi:hypothetical protein
VIVADGVGVTPGSEDKLHARTRSTIHEMTIMFRVLFTLIFIVNLLSSV